MEGIVNIQKNEEDILRCKEIVLKHVELEEHLINLLTIEIMDTALNIGGDFSNNNIEEITLQYVQLGGVERFLKRNH